jgi:hypothetical protein
MSLAAQNLIVLDRKRLKNNYQHGIDQRRISLTNVWSVLNKAGYNPRIC